MSASYNGFTVAFEEPVSEEYMNAVMKALKLYNGVIAVKPFVDTSPEWMLRQQVNQELSKELWDVLHGKKNKTV